MNDSEEDRLSGLSLEVFDPAPVAVAATRGWHHILVYTNTQFRSTFGDRPLGLPIREAFPDLLEEQYVDALDHVLASGEPTRSSTVPVMVGYPRGDVEERFFDFSLSALVTESNEPGVLFVLVDVTDQVLAADQIRTLSEERRRALQRYESLVATGSQLVWVAEADGRVYERGGGGWKQLTGRSSAEIRGHGWLDAAHPDDREAFAQAWFRAVDEVPALFKGVYRLRTAAGEYRHFDVRAVPIREDGTVLEWVGTCTDIEEQWQQERRRALLAKAAAAVSHSWRAKEAFAALAEVIVPTLADECEIYLLPQSPYGPARPGPTVVDRVASTTREGLRPGLPPLREEHIGADSAFARVAQERRPVQRSFPAGSVPDELAPPSTRNWLDRAGAHSGAIVPVLVDGAVAAIVTAFVCGDREPFGPADLALMSELFGQAHDTLSNALQLQRTQRVALALQHSLLTDPPDLPDLRLAARYLPSPSAEEVGGDWYDSFVLPDGVTALIIGDVAGHDLEAAVTMSKIRNMLRGLAADRKEPPGEILRRLDTATQILSPEEGTATCIYSRIEGPEGGPWQFSYSVAGHVPPLLVEATGRARYLQDAHNALLGLAPDAPRSSATEWLPAGSTLLLYTDGLIERYDEDLDEGLARLGHQAASLAGEPLDVFCDELLAKHRANVGDDIAMIAVRVPL